MALDIFAAHSAPSLLDDVTLVVMYLDQPNTRFVAHCLQRGINYIDITANYDFLAQVEQLDATVKANGSTALLSVGLAPGLTNLLASHARSQFDQLSRVDIHILLGLGEAHGEAAIRWTIANVSTQFTVQEGGTSSRVKSVADGQPTIFPGKLGKRTTYRFNFADQPVLPRTLGIDSPSTRLCFDSALVTGLLARFVQSGTSSVLCYHAVQDALVKLLNRFHVGSDQFAVQVRVQGFVAGQQRTTTYAVTGRGEGRMTGLVVAHMAKQIMTNVFTPGVFHIEQRFEPLPIIESVHR